MTVKRIIPLWEDELALNLLTGKSLLVVGHGNSLRALTKYLENVHESQMDTINIPNAQPIEYTLNEKIEVYDKRLL